MFYTNRYDIKNPSQRVVGQLSTRNYSQLMEFLLESIVLFLDKIKTQVYEDLEQFFVTKQEYLASKKYQKIQF